MRPNAKLLVSIAISSLVGLPAFAAPRLQCPAGYQIRTQKGQGFNPKNPVLSTDLDCRHPEVDGFYDRCKVELDSTTGQPSGRTIRLDGLPSNVRCRAITCGDGHVFMADGTPLYIFGFADVTNVPEADIMTRGNPLPDDGSGFPLGGANFSTPTMVAAEGEELYLTLTNSGMRERPDLFDPHTVHYHGFPNAASVFDGEPMASLAIGLGESITYYYNNQYAGTYMYHCHVEAAEHMQMGMLGNLYITPRQDSQCHGGGAPAYCMKPGTSTPWTGFAYDDGDGSTGYDVSFFLQEAGFDPAFHHADQTYQKIPFADMDDRYPLLNGRGYPDTVKPGPVINENGHPAQPIPAIPMTVDSGQYRPVDLKSGQRVLLRLSSLNTIDFFTVTVQGIPMRVVGQGAKLLRGPTGVSTAYTTSSVTLGGGEGVDVLLDLTGIKPGTYFLYTTNLNRLANDAEDYGGLMTELVVH
jgi:FtsP/CotA-like multicopper oxidase with cupredoxin domain